MINRTDEMDQAYELAGRLLISLAVCAVVLLGMLIGFMLT